MDGFDDLVAKILAKYPEKTREQVLEMVEKRKENSNGLLSDHGALSLVAQQLAVNQDGFEALGDQKISTAHAGLNDVTISGEVVDLSELREFPRQDGTTGKIVRLSLSDESGTINCALWDIHADQAVQLGVKIGTRLRLEHGYSKHGRGGEVELHLGNRGRIRLFEPTSPKTSPSDEALPWITVSELSANTGSIARRLRLRVRKVQGGQTINGPTTALCEDQTGLVIAKFWDDKIEEAAKLAESEKVIIIGNPTVIERNGIVYVNIGRNSSVKEDPATEFPSPERSVLSNLKPGPMLHLLSGKVVERTDVREIETKEGRRVRVANIRIEDETGRVRVSLWDRHAVNAETLRLGDMVKLIGVRVREGFNREVEASSVFLTEIVKTV